MFSSGIGKSGVIFIGTLAVVVSIAFAALAMPEAEQLPEAQATTSATPVIEQAQVIYRHENAAGEPLDTQTAALEKRGGIVAK